MKNKRFNHRQVLQLAIPMIVSNISTPLLGLVDTAVLGHLHSAIFLAAVALAGLIFSFIFWGFGFLRMGTTGLTAQAFGENNHEKMNIILIRALLLALIISCLILLLNQYLSQFSFWLLKPEQTLKPLALHYFAIRIWSTPAVLCSYVIMGWLLGQQNVKIPLLLMLISNISNIVLDLYFVYFLNMHITGVALASVIAEYIALCFGLIIVLRRAQKHPTLCRWKTLIKVSEIKAMLLINTHIFIRTWCLIFAFAFFTAQSAKLGATILAANALLLNFQTFMAYALDGFAHAAEAIVGQAKGAKNQILLNQAVKTAGLWSFLVAVFFAVIYLLLGPKIIQSLTSLEDVRVLANSYLPWLVLMPIISFTCYLFDGVFIGAMLSRQMRDSMIFSLFAVYLPVWYFTRQLGNQGLWLAMISFMFARSVSMTVLYKMHLAYEQTIG